MRQLSITPFICLLFAALPSCNNRPESHTWYTYIRDVGTYSSPQTADLNGDGILDLVIGSGGKEDTYCDSAILALNGADGKILWSLPGHNQYVGAARFLDIDKDGAPDVVIGGRWAQLVAVSGASGKTIWSFLPQRKEQTGRMDGWYNFTTPQLIPDQDNDGLQDLLIANGGDAQAAPFDTLRPAGRLLVLSSASGRVLANVSVPDGRETYMSVVCSKPQPDGNILVLFGTGGETIGGHLYRTTLQDIMSGDISNATILASSNTKGFVAPPVYMDITLDGIADIVVNTADGRMIALSGSNDAVLWQLEFPGTEAYTIAAPGRFTNDAHPDFFANFAIGSFPNLTRSIRFMVDGRNGQIKYQDTVPVFQYASPVAADLNGDGFDEVLINQSGMKKAQFENRYFSFLQVFDFGRNDRYAIGDTMPATNLASTPWLGDVDSDGRMDILFTAVKYEDARFDLQTPQGLLIGRLSTEIKMPQKLTWGAYMGGNRQENSR